MGSWNEILEDGSFSFDNRTAVDLKDKYRNICKKNSGTLAPFQATPVDRCDSLPTIEDVMLNEEGQILLKLALDQEEKIILSDEMPNDMLPALRKYRSLLRSKLRMVETLSGMLVNTSMKGEGVHQEQQSTLSKKTKREHAAAVINEEEKETTAMSLLPPLQIMDTLPVCEEIPDLDMFATQPANDHHHQPLNRRIESNDNDKDDGKDEEENKDKDKEEEKDGLEKALEEKKTRLVATMKQVRDDKSDNNCSIM